MFAALGAATVFYIIPIISNKAADFSHKEFDPVFLVILIVAIAICFARLAWIALFHSPKKDLRTPIECFFICYFILTQTSDYQRYQKDILSLLIIVYYASLLIRIRSEKQELFQLATDSLLSDIKDELLHTDLREKIIKAYDSPSVPKNMGIYGSWGVGKTIFAEKLFNEFAQAEHICVWINLWGLSGSDNIVNHYFDSIMGHISKDYYLYQSKSETNQAIKNLISEKLLIPNTLLSVFDIFQKSNTSDISRLECAINGPNKKIIVFLDNIERLTASEVLTTLRLINLLDTTKLNIFNIVTYDKIQLGKSLETELNIHNGNSYLDKIFIQEHSLPNLDFSAVDKTIDNFVEKKFSTLAKSEQADLRKMWSSNQILRNQISQDIHTPRHLLKFLNKFDLIFSSHRADINILDLFTLSYLELKYPNVYDKLKTSFSSIIYILRITGDVARKEALIRELDLRGDSSSGVLIDCLQNLFPTTKHPYPDERSLIVTKSFGHENFSRRYFSTEPVTNQYRDRDLSKMFEQDDADFIRDLKYEKLINSWDEVLIKLKKIDLRDKFTFLIADFLLKYVSSKFKDDVYYHHVVTKIIDLLKISNPPVQKKIYQLTLDNYLYVHLSTNLYSRYFEHENPTLRKDLTSAIYKNFNDSKSYNLNRIDLPSLRALLQFCYQHELLKESFLKEAKHNSNFAVKLVYLSVEYDINIYGEKIPKINANYSVFKWYSYDELRQYCYSANVESDKDEYIVIKLLNKE